MSREEARKRFKRIAEKRANRVLEDLRILMHCADHKNYDFDQGQVDKIFSPIEGAVAETKSKFIPRIRLVRRIEL